MAKRSLPEFMQVPWGVPSGLLVFALPFLLLPIIIVLMTYQLAAVFPAADTFYRGLMTGDLVASFTLALLNALAALAVVGFFLRRKGVGWSKVGWRRFNLVKSILYLVVIFIIFAVGVNLLLELVKFLDPTFNVDQPQENSFTTDTALMNPSLALIALVILPPIIEETVFRGFIFPAFSQRFGVIFGAITSSILFGLAHLQANVTIYTFVLGLLLCFMYIKLRSIFPGMALHMLNNYLAFMALAAK